MENILEIIQTLGFPIAVTIAMACFCKMIIVRVMDENKVRETKLLEENAAREERYNVLLREQSEKMDEISKTLAAINYKIDSLTEEKN